jgi:hypothetical protein|tara:strand:+ start:2114 stop:2455 length:342 start_codon:yes stop_codon:yes gene_type:complete
MSNEIEDYLRMQSDMARNSIDDATPEEWDRLNWNRASTAITEAVNHPPHYNQGDIETIDYIIDVLGIEYAVRYCHGNVLKYTGSRLFNKGKTIEDARKAIWYLNKMVELLENK